MTPISPHGDAWIDVYDGPLFDYVAARIQTITEPVGLYPFIFALRRGAITRIFIISSRNNDYEGIEAVARAACAAFDPDEAVFSYAANVLKDEKEIQGLVISCAKDAKPRLTFLRLEATAHGWIPVAVIGDAPNAERLQFMFKDAAVHFYIDQSERREEAKAALTGWMPYIAWDFDLGFDGTAH
jgi:hypothetical protein